jgi:hypothetical protein
MPDDILDAAQKSNSSPSNLNPSPPSPSSPVPPWSPMGSDAANAGFPQEPTPSPVTEQSNSLKFVTVPENSEQPELKPVSETEQIQNAGMVLDTILGTPSAPPPPPPKSTPNPQQPTFPIGTNQPKNPPKKKNFTPLVVGLLLLLGAVAAGVYFIAKPASIADLRGQAAVAEPCKICNASKHCVNSGLTPPECSHSADECSSDAGCGGIDTPKPTLKPPPTRTPTPIGAYHLNYNTSPCTCIAGAAPTGDVFGTFDGPTACAAQISACNAYKSSSCQTGGHTCVPDNWSCAQNVADTCPSGLKCGIGCSAAECILDPNTGGSDCPAPKLCVNSKCVNVEGNGKPIPCTFNENSCAQLYGQDAVVHEGGGNSCVNDQRCIYTNVECKIPQPTTAPNSTTTYTWCFLYETKDCKPENCSPNPTNTPVPPEGQCANIKIYKDGVQIDPTTLQPGDAVVLAVKGTENPTDAHFRVNGGTTWFKYTNVNNNGEFTYDFVIPQNVTDFTVEAEVLVNGIWK